MSPASDPTISPQSLPVDFPPRTFANLSGGAKTNLILLAAITIALSGILWPHWSDNPELSHGFLTPFIFVFLLLEARRGTPRFVASRALSSAATGALLLCGLLALCASGLYAAALDWSHALVACTLTISVASLLGAGLFVFSSRSVQFMPLNWPAVIAIALWLLSTPIPPGTYTRLTMGLQLAVTENVLRALHLLGIAASRHGNIIDLATASVGVEEACSGVRSLISCVYAGLLFSATLVRRSWARALLIALAAPLAIVMNFVRSLTLTLLANAGVDISGRWHDLTGFAVLGVTAVLLASLALALQRAPGRPPAARRATASVSITTAAPSLAGARILQRMLAGGLALALGLAGFFFANTRPSIRHGVPVPDLATVLPAASPGWVVETSKDLFQFSATLHTDHLFQRTYLRRTPAGVEQITIYVAYWRAGQAPVSLVASHTPDACWPGAGWVPVPAPQSREKLPLPDRILPDAESRMFKSGEFPQYVWFWHLYDGHPIAYRDPYSARELLRSAWRYGFSHDGDQMFVRLSSNHRWSDLSREPLLQEVFDRLQPLGL